MPQVVYGCRKMTVHLIDPETGLPYTEAPNDEPIEIDTPQQVSVAAQFSEGQRQELRGGDALVAVVEDDPVLVGLDLTFQDAVLNGEAVAVMSGGTFDAGEFTAPSIDSSLVAFQTKLWTARYAQASSHASDIIGYLEWTFHYCKGRLPSWTAQDRNFMVPQFTITCRENSTATLTIFSWEEITAQEYAALWT